MVQNLIQKKFYNPQQINSRDTIKWILNTENEQLELKNYKIKKS